MITLKFPFFFFFFFSDLVTVLPIGKTTQAQLPGGSPLPFHGDFPRRCGAAPRCLAKDNGRIQEVHRRNICVASQFLQKSPRASRTDCMA